MFEQKFYDESHVESEKANGFEQSPTEPGYVMDATGSHYRVKIKIKMSNITWYIPKEQFEHNDLQKFKEMKDVKIVMNFFYARQFCKKNFRKSGVTFKCFYNFIFSFFGFSK